MGKKKSHILGKSIIKDRFKTSQRRRNDGDDSWLHTSDLNDGVEWGRLNLNSVTEQSNLDDFLTTAELAGTEFTAERLNIRVVDPTDTGLPSAEETKVIKETQELNKKLLSIPRRPQWDASMTKEQLALNEREAFLEWRRQLALLQEKEHVVLTPFERNLEFWRQLWRVTERSDIIVQIVDARNPLLFRCEDLEKYVKEVGSCKENMVLINKADLLTEQQREQWADYFSQQGLRVAFWSAVLETERLKEEAALENQDSPEVEDQDSDEDQSSDSENTDSDDASIEDRLETTTPCGEVRTDVSSDGLTVENLKLSADQDEKNESRSENSAEGQSVGLVSSKTVQFTDSDSGPQKRCGHEDGCSHEEEDMEEGDENKSISSSRNECDMTDAHEPKDEDGRGSVEGTRRGSVVNSSALLTGEELIQFLYDLHKGPKVQEGVWTVGMVGYPNVGKSSTINAILQRKKVPVSATPGRTKHFQTLFVEPTLCLCDCPGLVMPSMVSSKGEMIISGILCIDHLRDFIPPVSLICQRIPRHILNGLYGINIIHPREGEDLNRIPTAREFLNAYAYMRGFMSNHGLPDCPRAARVILKDYVKGKLLYSHPPPGIDEIEFQTFSGDGANVDGDPNKIRRELSGPVITDEGTKLKQQPTSSKMDEVFFSQQTTKSHLVGAVGPRGLMSSVNSQEVKGPELSASQQRLIDKPWKKHGNRNKREKLRRVYGHLDAT
ncbi:large subunit GTPase 1 homolog [Asterias rubens]|uniref:large subunit GTPase 1 homolog n=1 Tax=Asterias rubens TaxID=7604 RepID=UPI00145559ED|nr:large subunit GTPase 1 homolog [Asterias rubens]